LVGIDEEITISLKIGKSNKGERLAQFHFSSERFEPVLITDLLTSFSKYSFMIGQDPDINGLKDSDDSLQSIGEKSEDSDLMDKKNGKDDSSDFY